jgi:hypothetical protein
LTGNYKFSHLSARSFIEALKKDIYELTNLDYFTFLLVNELVGSLKNDYHQPDAEHNSILPAPGGCEKLAFNIGVNLQEFFENYCFGACDMGCPVKPAEPVSSTFKILSVETPDGGEKYCQNKLQCLQSDILNYILIDSLVDFFKYEANKVLAEKDPQIVGLAGFLLNRIVIFILNEGQSLLRNYRSASVRIFEDLIQLEADLSPSGYVLDSGDSLNGPGHEVSAFESFNNEFVKEYLANNTWSLEISIVRYLERFCQLKKGLDSPAEISPDVLDEYILAALIYDISAFADPDTTLLQKITMKWIEKVRYEYSVPVLFDKSDFLSLAFSKYRLMVEKMKSYYSAFPIFTFLMDENEKSAARIRSLFRVEKYQAGFIRLTDVRTNGSYTIRLVPDFPSAIIEPELFLDCCLYEESGRWELGRIEAFFPASAAVYLKR